MKLINKILSLFKKKQIELSEFDKRFGFMLKYEIVEELEYNKVKQYYETNQKKYL